jgi:hypothetical protein
VGRVSETLYSKEFHRIKIYWLPEMEIKYFPILWESPNMLGAAFGNKFFSEKRIFEKTATKRSV